MLRQILNEFLDWLMICLIIATMILATLPAIDHELRRWQTHRCISAAPDRAIVECLVTAETMGIDPEIKERMKK